MLKKIMPCTFYPLTVAFNVVEEILSTTLSESNEMNYIVAEQNHPESLLVTITYLKLLFAASTVNVFTEH